MRDVRNTDDVIDSRDVIARIEELETERQELVVAKAMASQNVVDTSTDNNSTEKDYAQAEEAEQELEDAHQALIDWDNENDPELQSLTSLRDEAEGCSDWAYGETLIHEDYFETYAQELAGDLGLIQEGASWPHTCIDWKQAAKELEQDYTTVDFDGVNYLIRS